MNTSKTILYILLIITIIIVAFIQFSLYNQVKSNYNQKRKISKSYIINLPNKTEKYERVKEILKSVPNLERRDGVTIHEKPDKLKIRIGALGCTQAHLNIWNEISNLPEYDEDGNELWYLIFEDDIEFLLNNNIYETILDVIYKLPNNASIINFSTGEYMFYYMTLFFSILISKPSFHENFILGKGYNLHCSSYAIRPKSAKKCIEIVEKLKLYKEIDQILYHHYMFSNEAYCTKIFDQYRGDDSNKDAFGSDIR